MGIKVNSKKRFIVDITFPANMTEDKKYEHEDGVRKAIASYYKSCNPAIETSVMRVIS